MDIDQWLKDNTTNLQGQVVAMTGATGGLGRHVVRDLLQCNAKIIILERNVQKMTAFREELLKDFPGAEIDCVEIDLSQIKSINTAVAQIIDRRIDFLILSAGVYRIPVVKGELGYNNIFQINFIGQYYLMRQLLPALQRTNGKVVAVTSIAHDFVKLNEDDVDFTKSAKKASKIYGNAKRFLTLALSEFFRDRDDVRLALVHPGITLTPLTNGKKNPFVTLTMKVLFPNSKVAALNIVRGVFTDIECDEWIGPCKAKVWGAPAIAKLPESTAEERAKIYNIAEGICKNIEKSNLQ